MSDTTHDLPQAAEEDQDDPRVFATVIVGAISVILLFVLVVALEVLYYRTAEAEIQRKFVEQRPEQLLQVQFEQLEQLNQYRWVNQQEGVAAIPIERAMELTVQGSRAE